MDNSNNQPNQVPQQPQGSPAPAEQPVAPQPQQVGQPVMGSSNYQMPPKKGLSKGALWGIVGGSIGLVLLIVGVVLAVVLLGGPSKADYEEAAKLMRDLDTSDIMNLNNAGSDADSIKKAIDNGLAKVDDHHAKLKDTKAMRDQEVKKAFDAYISEYDQAKPVLQGMASSLATYQKYGKECSGGSFISTIDKTGQQAGEEFDKENASCISALEDMSKSSDKEMAKFAKDQLDYQKAMRAYYVAQADRYSKKDYSSPSPKYPSLPAYSNPLASSLKKIQDSKISEREKDLYNLLKEKADK